jgi:hypothetical protein
MQNAGNRLEGKGLAGRGQQAEEDALSQIHGVLGEEEEKGSSTENAETRRS